MATFTSSSSEGRQWTSSPRPKGRENAKNVLCRNVTIYGYCRHEKDGCMYNHETPGRSNHAQTNDSGRKKFNVESASFTPSLSEASTPKIAHATISPKAANAAPFTPKGTRLELSQTAAPSAVVSNNDHATEWSGHDIQEFIPQSFDLKSLEEPNTSNLDPFHSYSGPSSNYGGLDNTPPNPQVNPYAHDSSAAGGSTFYQQQTGFTQPLQHHLYAPLGPHRDNLLAYQRTAHDFFIPEKLRDELQRKAEASLQVLPNSGLPSNIEHFHSLVPLDTNNLKSTSAFGYNSWVYKAVSSKDGWTYVLRRIEGFRLTNDKVVRSVQAWKRISNSSIVTTHDCFTTRAFGDSSLVFVTDYHPLSKTIAEHHVAQFPAYQRNRSPITLIPEPILWSYIVQIASALKAIHSAGLAARLIIPSKVLVTSKNRIRLNIGSILDVVQPNENIQLAALQQDDMIQFGRLMLTLASTNNGTVSNARPADLIGRSYSERLRDCIRVLVEGSPQQSSFDINDFLSSIADHAFTSFDAALSYEDSLNSTLNAELENGRLVRLLTKLGFVNERPEFNEHNHGASQWSETGERYYLKLFRDYVFHQVTADGRPSVDLGHVLVCLNKLDAAIDEKIALVTRDEQNVFIVSYKEVKRGLEAAFQDLIKAGRRV